MKTIVNVSLVSVPGCSDPLVWLNRIKFFTGITSSLALTSKVYSFHCIDYEGVVEHDGVTFVFSRKSGLQNIFPLHILRKIAAINADVIIFHGLINPAYILQFKILLKSGTTVFAQHHAERPLRFHRKFLQHLADRFIKGYFFCSTLLGKQWVEAGQIASSEKIHEVMEVSSVFQHEGKIESRRRLNIRHQKVFLWVGRLDKNKDPETLIRAFIPFAKENSSAILFVIFQDDELLPELKRLAHSCEEQIKFVGKVAHQEMVWWYSSADVIVSTSHYEGSGVAVCEAISCGCFPIVTKIPSFRMMTREGKFGRLFPPGDEEALTAAFFQCIDTPLTRDAMIVHFHDALSFDAIARKIYSVVFG